TGTANDARDLATYGFLAPPKNPRAPAIAVGIWMGNSDHSNPKSAKPATSLTASAPLWRAFVRDLTAKQPIATFRPPKGVVRATIDAWTGGAPGPWTRDTVTEWFIDGTQPGGSRQVDELGPPAWDPDVANWLSRARRGVGVLGPNGTRTAYFWQRTGWGGPLLGTCA